MQEGADATAALLGACDDAIDFVAVAKGNFATRGVMANCSVRFLSNCGVSATSKDWNSVMPLNFRSPGIVPEATTGGPRTKPMRTVGSMFPRGAGSPSPTLR